MTKTETAPPQDGMFPAAEDDHPKDGKVPEVTIEEAAATSASLLEAAVKTTMEREVAGVFHKLEAEKQRFEFHQRIAKLFVASGLFDDLKDMQASQAIARAMLKIELGWSIGLSPAESVRSIYFTPGGRPEIDAAVRAARMKRSGYDWRIQRLDADACVLEMWKAGRPLIDSKGQQAIVSFTMRDAESVKVWNRKQAKMIPLTESNPTYKSYPRNMLFSRCITNAQRWFAPEALNGVNFADTTERFEIEDLEVGHGAPRPLFAKDPSEELEYKAALAAELAKEGGK